MLKLKQLTINDIEWTVTPTKEFITPEESMKGATPEEVASFVETIKQAKKYCPTWGWCTIEVAGSLKGNPVFNAHTTLAACSYEGKKDFIENSGYYADMQKEVLSMIQELMENVAQPLIQNGFIVQEEYSEFGG